MNDNPMLENATEVPTLSFAPSVTPSAAPTATNEDSPNELLFNAFKVYVPMWIVGFFAYCILRKRIPRTFATRQWVQNIQTPLARDQFGWFSWIWKVYSFSEDELLREIGLDALCFLRLVNMGFRLSCVGVFNSLWLMPLYATTLDEITDVRNFSVNALEPDSNRFIGPVLASYIFFGYCYCTIVKEWKWFVRVRHAWLSQFRPPNFTILVRNIPEDLRSDLALYEHFGKLYGRERVQEAHCCLFLSDLEGMVKKRKNCVANLEHAMAFLELKGTRPKHFPLIAKDSARRLKRQESSVDSIDYYQQELDELNEKIADHIDAVEVKCATENTRKFQTFNNTSRNSDSSAHSGEGDSESTGRDESSRDLLLSIEGREALYAVANQTRQATVKTAKKRFRQAKKTISTALELANNILSGVKDGTPDDAGFVTFNSLVAMHGALQMKQHPQFFALEAEIAPEPFDIFWDNVGKDREVLQTGRLISIALTVTLCLFWTFIVTFIVNLTDPDVMIKENGNAKDFLVENDWAATLLGLLSPVLLLILNSGLLPIILKAVSRFEFPASDSLLEASAFWKMASFTVIQTFL